MKLRMLIVVGAVLFTLPLCFGAGQPATHVPLPADLQGELDGVPYRILVPENWNGTLLVYAHGYGDTEIPPPLAPQPADAVILFNRGFALAASRFAGAVPMAGMANEGGYQVKEGIQNTVALTAAFNGIVGRPERTIIWGKSMGGNVALGMIEKFPGHFDGAIVVCGTNAGASRRWDQALDTALAYAVTFGWNPQWGTPGDIRDDLNIMTEVLPHIQQQMVPSKKGLWEFIRLVNRMPSDSYYINPGGMPLRLLTLYFALAVRAELESRAGRGGCRKHRPFVRAYRRGEGLSDRNGRRCRRAAGGDECIGHLRFRPQCAELFEALFRPLRSNHPARTHPPHQGRRPCHAQSRERVPRHRRATGQW